MEREYILIVLTTWNEQLLSPVKCFKGGNK